MDVSGALVGSQASLKDCEDRHKVALEIIGEKNESVEQLQEDLAEMKHILKIHMEFFLRDTSVC